MTKLIKNKVISCTRRLDNDTHVMRTGRIIGVKGNDHLVYPIVQLDYSIITGDDKEELTFPSASSSTFEH